jgi:hypothetical protein
MQLAGRHGGAVPVVDMQAEVGSAPELGSAAEAGSAAPGSCDPRRNGVFPVDAEARVRDHLVELCTTCRTRTPQDYYDVLSTTWVPSCSRLPWRRRPEEVERRGFWRVCTRCACVFPINAAAREMVALRGGEHFDPARGSGAP